MPQPRQLPWGWGAQQSSTPGMQGCSLKLLLRSLVRSRRVLAGTSRDSAGWALGLGHLWPIWSLWWMTNRCPLFQAEGPDACPFLASVRASGRTRSARPCLRDGKFCPARCPDPIQLCQQGNKQTVFQQVQMKYWWACLRLYLRLANINTRELEFS